MSTAVSERDDEHQAHRVDHPLAPLSGEEITAAADTARAHGDLGEGALFAYIGLSEPPKEEVRAFDARRRAGRAGGAGGAGGDGTDATVGTRRVRLVIVTGPEADVIEAVVALPPVAPATGAPGTVERWDHVPSTRPALLMEESLHAILALREHAGWQEAMRRRGIEDLDKVQIDPWPAGNFGVEHETDRRITRCLSYLRDGPEDNGYARPIEGVVAFVDMGRGEVLEVVDTGVVPVPEWKGSYLPEDNGPLRDDLKPLEIVQPEGPSFTVEGNLIRWQRWSLRVTMDPLEGLVLHTVGYEDRGRVRPILYRASISEMVVPYGEPGPLHGWKNAFDVGEWGLGRMANSLTLGCDCLGEIYYFDDVFADERGRPHTRPNAICMHEEDYGILWKHNDMHAGRVEVRRSRRLVVSSIATVGNYEYGFYWYFYLDGTIQLEVKLTGILSTMAVAEGEELRFAAPLAPGLAAPFHQHLFNARLDMEVDGPENAVYEVETTTVPGGPDNPWRNAFEPTVTLLRSEQQAQRLIDPARSRHWRVVNHRVTNGLGRPVAYKLLPGATPTLLADEESSVGRRARFATKNLWVTQFAPDEFRAAGDHPNQHEGGDGLPRWTAADRDLVDQDVVLWHTFGVTHLPRPEDFPVMPVEYTGFSLVALGFFDHNPALDVPPSSSSHCHSNTQATEKPSGAPQ